MKIAVLADIHSNLMALQAVTEHLEAWRPDHVIVAGDVINRGPRPLECLSFVQAKQHRTGWLVVKGNHEDYVLKHVQPDAPRSGPAFETHQNSFWTYRQLSQAVIATEAWPFSQRWLGPDQRPVVITHASMRHNRDGIHTFTSDAELREKIQPSAGLFCVGHTHRPLTRQLDGTLVVNVGAVGLPFDGDVRACYSQICWQHGCWVAQIIRLDYDRQQAEQDFFESGYMNESGPLAYLILDEFRTARSHLYQWTEDYQEAVLTGRLSVADSVSDYMARKQIVR